MSWKLSFLDHGKRKPFGAGGVFVRLLDAAGGAPAMAFAEGTRHANGVYLANVTVPAGGMRGIQIGLRGTSDVLFPIRNNPFALRRALHLPTVAPDAPCPVSQVDPTVQFSMYGVGNGIGPGPAYPIFGTGTLQIAPPKNFGSTSWGGQKVLWFVLPSYSGPVLIRGGRLDAPGLVRFEIGDVPPRELMIPGRNGPRGRPSYTRLEGPGCYVYQIDGTTFSRIIVFRAEGP